VLVIGSISFVAFRFVFDEPGPEDPAPGPLPPQILADSGPPAPPEPAPAPPAPAPPTAADEGLPVPYGRDEAGIADLGVEVPDGQGLLVLEPNAAGAPMQVEVDDGAHEVAAEPVGVALAPGVHHLTITRGDRVDFLWVAIQAGRTRHAPPLP